MFLLCCCTAQALFELIHDANLCKQGGYNSELELLGVYRLHNRLHVSSHKSTRRFQSNTLPEKRFIENSEGKEKLKFQSERGMTSFHLTKGSFGNKGGDGGFYFAEEQLPVMLKAALHSGVGGSILDLVFTKIKV